MGGELREPVRGYGTVMIFTNREQDAWRAACSSCSYKSRANKTESAIIERAKNHRCPDVIVASPGEDKAHRYLAEGRVTVLEASPGRVVAEVRGTAEDPYRVAYNSIGWACNCDARVPVCTHIVAVRSVTDPDRFAADHEPNEYDRLFDSL